MSDQQMRYAQTLYPVDRYLVESSKQIDMINIIDDDIWMSEPALRPEDEIILRKLHDMLQSTADDLKLLSGELSKYHEPGVQKKSLPTPLDDEFNEKVHIEEIVNAKFHGHKIIDSIQLTPKTVKKDIIDDVVQSMVSKTKSNVNTTSQPIPSVKKASNKRNLGITETKILQIHENRPSNKNHTIEKNIENSAKNKQSSCIAYNEFFHIYEKPKLDVQTTPRKPLQIQEMPRINIRSELQEQKVVQLDIVPEPKELQKCESDRSNALVIEVKHEPAPKYKSKPATFDHIQLHSNIYNEKPTVRKVSKMSVYESSESTDNVSSECQKKNTRKKLKEISIQQPARSRHDVSRDSKKRVVTRKDIRYTKPTLEEWKNKLSGIYGTTSRNSEQKFKKTSPKKPCTKKTFSKTRLNKDLNNIEYIPYSKLTLGGVNVSDIEKEISNIPNRQEIVLSPILDKILSSRENSFHKQSPVKNQNKKSKVLTTSDENLLQEVLDIEKQVIQTMSAINLNENATHQDDIVENTSSNASNNYVDDFEDDKSNEHASDKEDLSKSESLKSDSSNCLHGNQNILSGNKSNLGNDNINISNKIFTKVTNLSFKNKVDIFEFVPPNDTQDTGTQSTISSYIKPQETQTSPQNGNSNIQSIRNDLWSSIDPKGEVEEMFKLEKDFIKNLIIKEYGDLIEENLKKPSTSKNTETERNIKASQKNTQTSPAHVKSIMTSPKRTKTRTTSPFALSVSVHQQTSPFAEVANNEELKVEMEKDQDFDLSVNLSSPRFSLRLPQTSRNVLSNVDGESIGKFAEKFTFRKYKSSSSTVDGDYSSSDISSIGEINNKYKRRLMKGRIPSLSELSSSSSMSRYATDPSGSILPLKSEGEASLSQISRKKTNKVNNKSEGEISVGQWS